MMQTILVAVAVAGALGFLGTSAWRRAKARGTGHACPGCSLAKGAEPVAPSKVASSDAKG